MRGEKRQERRREKDWKKGLKSNNAWMRRKLFSGSASKQEKKIFMRHNSCTGAIQCTKKGKIKTRRLTTTSQMLLKTVNLNRKGTTLSRRAVSVVLVGGLKETDQNDLFQLKRNELTQLSQWSWLRFETDVQLSNTEQSRVLFFFGSYCWRLTAMISCLFIVHINSFFQ